MRGPAPLVPPHDNGNLRNTRANLRSFNDKFRCKFHPRATNAQPIVQSARKTPHATIAVADTCPKQQVEQGRETGIPNVLVVPRHSSGSNASAETIPHD